MCTAAHGDGSDRYRKWKSSGPLLIQSSKHQFTCGGSFKNGELALEVASYAVVFRGVVFTPLKTTVWEATLEEESSVTRKPA